MSSSHLNNPKSSSNNQNHNNQIQTIATVHSQHQQPGPQQAPNSNQLQSQNQRTVKNSSNIIGGGIQIIPPKYQPPPQPLGGILKHLSGAPNSSSTGTKHYFVGDLSDEQQLNIKYPPDIPKLSSIYIPEPHSRQRPLQQRIPTGQPQYILSSNHDDNHNMLKFVRKAEQEQGGVPVSNIPTPGSGRLTSEQNRHLQSLLSDLRALKEANQRLIDDNQELRDLCCFLDDDRQKGRKLAREWQRFGRYTASVMRQEVSAYQNKLRQLDDKQQELIRDNLELKELCLYLDEERAHVASNNLCANCGSATRPLSAALNRDDGDGSSYSTVADETIPTMRNFDRQMTDMNMRSSLSDQTLQYVRSLEQRIHQLEEERMTGANSQDLGDPLSGRPEAVVRALQVLEVREQLERDRIASDQQIEQMDDGEKALVREMCNVVWRKLEESPNGPNMEE